MSTKIYACWGKGFLRNAAGEAKEEALCRASVRRGYQVQVGYENCGGQAGLLRFLRILAMSVLVLLGVFRGGVFSILAVTASPMLSNEEALYAGILDVTVLAGENSNIATLVGLVPVLRYNEKANAVRKQN